MIRIEDSEKFSRFQTFRPDDAFHDRTAFSAQDFGNWLVTLLSNYAFKQDEWEFLVAAQIASEGRHRRVKLAVSQIPEGQSTAPLKSAEIWHRAMEIADWIDIQVAQGVKQDAALHEACGRWNVTRRDAFRYLKKVRAWRVVINGPDYTDWGYIDGFEIAPDGKLVTKA